MTDVIIVLTKPGKDAAYYQELIARQTKPVHELILVRAPGAVSGGGSGDPGALPVKEVTAVFDALGYLLTQGVKASRADTFLFLHEDVTLVSEELLEKLAGALSDTTAMAFSRTLPGEKQTRIRDAYQAFYQPGTSEERTERTLFRKGFLQFDTGDSAILLTRTALEQAGGFEAEALVSPFSIIAAELFYQKKTLHYEADAAVVRKPDSASPAAVFHRAFDLSAAMRAHVQIFGLSWRYSYKDEKLHRHPVILLTRPGIYTKKLAFSLRMLCGQGRIHLAVPLLFLYLLELLGNALGSGAHLLPVKIARLFSAHKAWFTD